MSSPTKTVASSPYLVYTGIAAEDIKPDSDILEVICPELTPHALTGTVGAGITTATTTLQDRDGNTITGAQTTSNHIVATWEGASNQRVPPLVRKAESVEVYQVANQDKYYWRTTGRARDFRKTDRVHFEVGAIPEDSKGQEKNDTNTYSAYLDSHNKKVGFKTSQANGEASAFSMEADLDAGTFHISDNGADPGNRIFLDTGAKSGVPTFQVNLTSGATLKFEKDNLFIKVPKMMQIDVGERIVMNSPLTVFNLQTTGAFIINAASVAINGAKDFVVSAGVVGFNTASAKISGVLVAAAARIANAVKGSAGSNYAPATVARPQETPVSMPSNTADTSVTGTPYSTS